MSEQIKALKLALDALENHTAIKHPQQIHYRDKAIAAIKEALAQQEQWGASAVGHPAYVAEQKRKTEELRSMLTQPEQKPVAWRSLGKMENGFLGFRFATDRSTFHDDPDQQALYLCQSPQRPRVLFPTMLRKMWSGGEVQAWLDENVNKENT